jgi:hypothetical protein
MLVAEGQHFPLKIKTLPAGSPIHFPRMFSHGLANKTIRRNRPSFYLCVWTQAVDHAVAIVSGPHAAHSMISQKLKSLISNRNILPRFSDTVKITVTKCLISNLRQSTSKCPEHHRSPHGILSRNILLRPRAIRLRSHWDWFAVHTSHRAAWIDIAQVRSRSSACACPTRPL